MGIDRIPLLRPCRTVTMEIGEFRLSATPELGSEGVVSVELRIEEPNAPDDEDAIEGAEL